MLCITKKHLNTIGGGTVTFDYFSMEPTALPISLSIFKDKFEKMADTTFSKSICDELIGVPETAVGCFRVGHPQAV
jgi:hypothetical protein